MMMKKKKEEEEEEEEEELARNSIDRAGHTYNIYVPKHRENKQNNRPNGDDVAAAPLFPSGPKWPSRYIRPSDVADQFTVVAC